MPGGNRRFEPVRGLVRRGSVAYSRHSRRQKAKRFCSIIREDHVQSVLLVGAASDTQSWSNIVERAVIDTGVRVVISGLGPDLDFPTESVYCDGLSLPFADKTFDLVISNAVIEHVGGAAEQAAFIAEHQRVGRAFIVTTPNRWFPIESHTRTIVRHWSPRWRSLRHEFTRLLSRAEFAAMLPSDIRLTGHRWSPTFTAYSSQRSLR
jgi:SAM-dependent methyltransferase